MSENSDPPKKIIVDEDWKSQVEQERASLKQRPETPDGSAQAADSTPPEMPPASFAWLVTMLATEAMAALGQLPDPLENKPVVHLDLAQHHIDMLAMLEAKTKGNLDAHESQMLETMLHQLRMVFVAIRDQIALGGMS